MASNTISIFALPDGTPDKRCGILRSLLNDMEASNVSIGTQARGF